MPSLNKYKEVVSGIFMLTVSVFYLVNAFKIKILSRAVFNASMFPKILGVSLAVLSIAQIVGAIMKMRKTAPAAEGVRATGISRAGKLRVAATLVALIIYLAFMRKVGFLIMTVFYVLAQILILTPRGKLSIPLLLILSIVFPAAVYLLFVYGFQLLLPMGLLDL